MLEGKRVILVDDSIVRGTTSKKIVEMVRAAGAQEVHMRISSPPTTHSCFYGIDTPERDQAAGGTATRVEEMADLIGADSLAFISLDGLYRALGRPGRDPAAPQFCDACFTGDYPIALPDQQDNAERQLEPADGKLTWRDYWTVRWRWSPARAAASAPQWRWNWRGMAPRW